jgi:protein-S-isoprenylcysteine O-methyltransferase
MSVFDPGRLPLDVAGLIALAWVTTEATTRLVARRHRAPIPERTGKDRGSFVIIAVGMGVSVDLSFGLYLRGIGPMLPSWTLPIGASLGIAGIALRGWAIVVLGRFFSPVIRIEAGHRIVREGPYRWVRHPSYTGALLALVGVSAALGTVPGTLLTLAVGLLVFGYRILVEERMLAERFGEEYRAYARETWRLFPGIY